MSSRTRRPSHSSMSFCTLWTFGLAAELSHEAEVLAVTTIVLLLAVEGGVTAIGVDFAHRTGARNTGGADVRQDAGASLFQCADGGGHGLTVAPAVR